MKNYELTIENGEVTFIKNFEEVDGVVTPFDGVLHIPAEVTDLFGNDSVIGCYPEDIVVEEGNQVYCAKEHCLFTKDGRELLMLSKKSTIPADTKVIGANLLPYAIDVPAFADSLVIPQGVEEIKYRALASGHEKYFVLLIPQSVKKLCLMSLMITSPRTVIPFKNDLELELGVFGTKAEADAMEDDFGTGFKSLPEALYVKPETLHIVAPKCSNIAAYCKKYGIPCVEQ